MSELKPQAHTPNHTLPNMQLLHIMACPIQQVDMVKETAELALCVCMCAYYHLPQHNRIIYGISLRRHKPIGEIDDNLLHVKGTGGGDGVYKLVYTSRRVSVRGTR